MESNTIRIRGANGQINVQQLTCYLCQTVLALRDRNNLDQSVELQGTGSAIPTCILIAELTARKLPKLSQITQFVPIKKKTENKENKEEFKTGIRIKLTYIPTEEDKKAPGYQTNVVDEKQAANWDSLYQFVMLYASDLAAAKLSSNSIMDIEKANKKTRRPQRQHSQKQKSISNNHSQPAERATKLIYGNVISRGQERGQNRGVDREQQRRGNPRK